jgi:hypothetical protein
MRIHYLCVPVTAAIALSIVPSLAGPCSGEIDRIQPGVEALIAQRRSPARPVARAQPR